MEEKIPTNLLRGSVVITLRCTLRCKLCAAYVPCYDNQPHFSYEKIAKTIDNYFSIVDTVGDFSLSGGEPLLHEDLGRIIKKTLEYSDRINRLLILTNGTLLFKDEVLEILKENRDKCHVNISDYGYLSSKASKLADILQKNMISHRTINYSGDNLFCDGWVDYGDHSRKAFTQEETDKKGARCVFRKMNSTLIQDGEIHRCGRAFRRMELGIIPKNKSEYVDLFDDSISNTEKRKTIINLFNAKSTTSCAFCNGLCDDSERFPAAEQIAGGKL